MELSSNRSTQGGDAKGTVYQALDYAKIEANLSEFQRNLIQNYSTEGKKCMMDFWAVPTEPGTHCNGSWDEYQCWPATPVNTTVRQPCSWESLNLEYNITLEVDFSDAFSHRTCSANGTWWTDGHRDWTDYTQCARAVVLANYVEEPGTYPVTQVPDPQGNGSQIASILRDIYFFGGIISCLLLLITFFIFTYFKSLQCNRISIHKHLVVSFIIRSALLVVMFEPYVSKRQHSYKDINWLCKAVMACIYYSIVANIFWMFVEGLFLHNRVAVSVFNTEAPFRVFYVVGWGLPAAIIFSWAMCMIAFSQHNCWYDAFKLPYIWIILIPVCTALAINMIFLINIIRILVTKLRANNTVETDQIRKAVKATAILFPLLGMTNLFYLFAPEEGQVSVITVMSYRITNAVLQSAQGIFVSVIYCFMNAEVRSAILKRWQRHKAGRMGDNRGRRRSSRTSSLFLSTSENCNHGGPRHSFPSVSVPHYHVQLNTQL